MKHNIPLIFLDLDGTLIGTTRDIEAPVLKALKHWRNKGVRLSVCTGRPSGGIASRIAKAIDPDGLHSFHGGATVYDGSGQLLKTQYLHKHAIAKMVHHARAHAHTLELYTTDAIFVDSMTPEAKLHAHIVGVPSYEVNLLSDVNLDTIVKAQWVTTDMKTALLLERVHTPDTCFAATATSGAMPGHAFVTVTSLGVDKRSAVHQIADHFGVSPLACAAVGDTVGDVPMLDCVGHPFIMGDASDALKSRYRVLPGVDAHGILSFWDHT